VQTEIEALHYRVFQSKWFVGKHKFFMPRFYLFNQKFPSARRKVKLYGSPAHILCFKTAVKIHADYSNDGDFVYVRSHKQILTIFHISVTFK
jgi:hypothetical protein